MKTTPLLVLAILAANALAFDPQPPPSSVPTSRRDFLYDVAIEGFRKVMAVGGSTQHLRLDRFTMDYKGDWTVDSAHPDCGEAMGPNFYGIAHSKTRFVAVGRHDMRYKDPSRVYPAISVSDDGFHWKGSQGSIEGGLSGIATDSENLWVAAGTNQILFSEDGADSWIIALDQTGGDTRTVGYGKTGWMAATELSREPNPGWTDDKTTTRFHFSVDGRIWSQVAQIQGSRIASLAEGDGAWVAVGESFMPGHPACILRSTDQGKTWTEVAPSVVGARLHDVTWGDKTGFVAVGGVGYQGLALWSRDGSSWQKIHEPFNGNINAVQLWEPPRESEHGMTEIVMVGDTGAVWLDTLEFSTRRSTADTRIVSRPIATWKQIGSRLEVPQWVSGNILVNVLSLDGRVESSSNVYLGTSRTIELPRSWGQKILRIRDEAGGIHVQKLAPTIPLF